MTQIVVMYRDKDSIKLWVLYTLSMHCVMDCIYTDSIPH